MRKLCLTFLIFPVFMMACNRTTQNAPNSENLTAVEDAAQLKFAESTHDFGQMTAGDIVRYPFKFKNVGKTPLVIQNVSVQCGCTVASKPEEPIPPGGSSQIVVQFNSTGKSGIQTKVVTVTSNAIPAQSKITFTAIVANRPPNG